MSARRRLPAIGSFVNPLLWWLRLWGLAPDREKELAETRSVLERQQARVETLSAQLRAREADADQLQARVRQLEQLQAEVEQLRTRIAELQVQQDGDKGEPADESGASEEPELPRDDTPAAQQQAGAEAASAEPGATEEPELPREEVGAAGAHDVGEVEAVEDPGTTDEPELPREAAAADGQPADTDQVEAIEEPGTTDEPELPRDTAGDGQPATSPPDVSEAATVLGVRIVADDLKAIEGVGPKIAGLLNAAGITTWQALAEANPADLRQILTDAGPRYRLHNPENWPAQAALLAGGRWDEFKQLSERVRRPRTG